MTSLQENRNLQLLAPALSLAAIALASSVAYYLLIYIPKQEAFKHDLECKEFGPKQYGTSEFRAPDNDVQREYFYSRARNACILHITTRSGPPATEERTEALIDINSGNKLLHYENYCEDIYRSASSGVCITLEEFRSQLERLKS